MTNNGKINLAILISGSGTNLQAIIDACQQPEFPAQIRIVICNNPDAYGIIRAQQAGIKCVVINHKNYSSRAEFDAQIHQNLLNYNIDLICLAGFMRILSADFINHWPNKIINIHPSLLPAFKGANAQKDAIEYGVKITGCTTHFVTSDLDSGPIILQEAVNISPNETPESLRTKMLTIEHQLYINSIKFVADNIINKR